MKPPAPGKPFIINSMVTALLACVAISIRSPCIAIRVFHSICGPSAMVARGEFRLPGGWRDRGLLRLRQHAKALLRLGKPVPKAHETHLKGVARQLWQLLDPEEMRAVGQEDSQQAAVPNWVDEDLVQDVWGGTMVVTSDDAPAPALAQPRYFTSRAFDLLFKATRQSVNREVDERLAANSQSPPAAERKRMVSRRAWHNWKAMPMTERKAWLQQARDRALGQVPAEATVQQYIAAAPAKPLQAKPLTGRVLQAVGGRIPAERGCRHASHS